MKRLLLIAIIGVCFLVLCACDKHGEVKVGSGELALSDPQPSVSPPCARAVVTSGLGYGWERLNHRLSLWRITPEFGGLCPPKVPDDASLGMAVVGGSFTTGTLFRDNPWFDYDYFSVDSPQVRFIPGRAVLYVTGPEFITEEQLQIQLPDLGEFVPSTAVALVQGMEIYTGVEQSDPEFPADYDPALGYTSKGLGIRLSRPELTNGRATFDVRVRCQAAVADRDDMNAAVPHSTTRMVVDYLLVLIDQGAAIEQSHGYTLHYDKPKLLREQQIDHATAEQRRVELQGTPGLQTAFIGLAGFNWKLFEGARGDYLRALSCRARLAQYDPASGLAVVDLDGYASHASIIAYESMVNDFSADVVLVQLASGSALPQSLSGSFEVGSTRFDLALGPESQ
ncbi:MAG: hypothetical protein P9M14_04170 [Candidatus Alcyoniella australis]|nr:hypothetical protein [Candidatus Alcyoniella australis]